MTRACFTTLCFALLSVMRVFGGENVWAPAATVGGVPYQSVDELRGFYKLDPDSKPAHAGAYSMSLGRVPVELGPGSRELRIGGIRLTLMHPLQKDAEGKLLISREDWVKWVDPILRPTYIAGRKPVRVVMIDAAHGGHDTGMMTAQVSEAVATLHVANCLKAELESMGLKAELTRTGDYFLSEHQRLEAAKTAQPSLFITLHINSGRSDYHGSQVYTAAPAAPGKSPTPSNEHDADQAALAFALQAALVGNAGVADGGCAHTQYSMLSALPCPAAWVELGYATHPIEGAALGTQAYREQLAHALALGIAAYAKTTEPTAQIPVQQPNTRPASPPSGSGKSTTSSGKTGSGSGKSTTSSGKTGSGSGKSTTSSGKTGSGKTTTTKPKNTTTKPANKTGSKPTNRSGTGQNRSTTTKRPRH